MPRLFDLLANESSQHTLKDMAARKRTAERPAPVAKAASPIPHAPKQVAGIDPMSVVGTFVALDCETTGLDDKNDRITEIGAVRFEAGVATASFCSFVNPGRPIPALITELTGITNEHVASAPSFVDIAPSLSEFIGLAPLCGHQVDFDFGFLNEEFKRIGKPKLENQQIDTAQLSRIILPSIGSYSLSYVARTCGVKLESAHRALDDARASGLVAVVLFRKVSEIAYGIRRKMAYFSPHGILKDVLFQTLGKRQDSPPDDIPLFTKETMTRLPIPEEFEEIDAEETTALFSEGGTLSQKFEGFLPRPGQITMASQVAITLNRHDILMAEAGTGTGKSLAYLIPGALYALKNNCRVLVSTHTRNLQDQLFLKDLPKVAEVVGNKLMFSVLKGRSNYLCKLRYYQLIDGQLGSLSPRERAGVLPLIRWADETHTGDIEEQNQFNRSWFGKIWNLLSADTHDCKGRQCPLFTSCYLWHARFKALSSHVVVINHALFFSELCSESSFLGQLGPMIFDEAHHLESCGHKYLRTEVDSNRFSRYVEFVNSIAKKLERHQDDPAILKLVKSFDTLLKKLRKQVKGVEAEIAAWSAEKAPDRSYQVAYRDYPFEGFVCLTAVSTILAELQDALHTARQDSAPLQGDEGREVASDVEICAEKTSQLKADLAYVTGGITEEHLFWVEGDREKGWVKLCGVPLDIGDMLQQVWSRTTGGILFTSATLLASTSGDYAKSKLGLAGAHASKVSVRVFASPFVPEQALSIAVQDIPDPTLPAYAAATIDAIVKLSALGKNMLVLFTNTATMQEIYSGLRLRSEIDKKKLFAQNITGNRHASLDLFKQTSGAILLGTDSFWEGIDAPGESCEIVVITRLPFPVPTHPLAEALAARAQERYGDSFFNYAIPEALIKFRQGAGRLIRTSSDTGALVILDNRIISKGYGKQFSRALGNELITSATLDDMVSTVQNFFSSGVKL